MAIPQYEDVLRCSVTEQEVLFGRFDLRKEAAFNLSLIFREAGDHKRASELCRTYLAV
jgi:hypothetical protein